MRLHLILLAAGLCHAVFPLSVAHHSLSVPRHGDKRALTDLINLGSDDDDDTLSQVVQPTQAEQVSIGPARVPQAGETIKTESGLFGLFPPFVTTIGVLDNPKLKGGTSTTSASSSSSASASSSSSSTSASPWPTSVPTPSASSPSNAASQPPSGGSSSSTSTTWKIIGVAVIAFSVVSAILLASVFFDYWWGFVRDTLWRRRKADTVEELVPDWEKASWEVRFGDDRHRYPSFTAPPPPRSILGPPQGELARNKSVLSTASAAGLGRNRSVMSAAGRSRPVSYVSRQAVSPAPAFGLGLPLGEQPTSHIIHSPHPQPLPVAVNPFESAEVEDAYGGMAET